MDHAGGALAVVLLVGGAAVLVVGDVGRGTRPTMRLFGGANVGPDEVPNGGGNQCVLDGEGVKVGCGFLGDVGQDRLGLADGQ